MKKRLVEAFSVVLIVLAARAEGQTVDVIEYYNAAQDHYFVSSLPADINAIDSGRFKGWVRTGLTFRAIDRPTLNASPVCRFYIPPAQGDSHFYSASTWECAQTAAKFPSFVEESTDVMYIDLPDPQSGACPVGDAPVYRVWNNRVDSNHRYITDPAVRAQMVAKGWVAEGYGPDSVIMCSPPALWWDNFPRLVNFINTSCAGDTAAKALALNADIVSCNSSQDPTMGTWAQRVSILTQGGAQGLASARTAGLKTQTFSEGFGQSFAFIAQVKKDGTGNYVKDSNDPLLTRQFNSYWGWNTYDGTGEIQWGGVHNYFGGDAFAEPYTFGHARYGASPVKYPDGTIATGFRGVATDPRNSAIYDACSAKDVTGKLSYDYESSDAPQRTGFLSVGADQSGFLLINKDAACPSWAEYARASNLQAIDYGLDSIFEDQWSAWGGFGSNPVKMAFGEWSVATFRDYLQASFSVSDLSTMGIRDVKSFDVRTYLLQQAAAWGGKAITDGGGAGVGNSVVDPVWRDVRWLDDPIWRAYKIHKRRIGTQALANLYRGRKDAAAIAGKRDFLVTGNDFDGTDLWWQRGEVDMVNSELNYLPSNFPPPAGSYISLYKRARESARSRFVMFWHYVPPAFFLKPGIADVLHYEALANHALPAPWAGDNQVTSISLTGKHTAGNDATTAAFYKFLGSARTTFGQRSGLEEIGIYYSPSSELAHMTLNGWPAGDGESLHTRAYFGWGTALSWLHQQWRAVPEWKLTAANLASLKLLIIPSSEVFDPSDVQVVRDWVSGGGHLIVTGNSGARAGESGNFQALGALSLSTITGVSKPNDPRSQVVTNVGSGVVLYIRDDGAIQFNNNTTGRPDRLPAFSAALSAAKFSGSVVAPSVPYTVGLTLYNDLTNRRFFVDANNTDIDIASDTIHPAAPIHLEVALPPFLASTDVVARVLSPDTGIAINVSKTPNGTASIDLTGMLRYASVVLEASR